MSRLAIPKVVLTLDLSQYAPGAPETSDQPIRVWVNPPRAMLAQWDALIDQFQALNTRASEEPEVWKGSEGKAAVDGFFAWWAELWSQGPEETHWTAEEVQAFKDECLQDDPPLWEFVTSETWRLIAEHRKASRKN